jgi:gamma-glutamylcyclotransferase (GGCT)/AIG2-like uncharacterized protein YtfP
MNLFVYGTLRRGYWLHDRFLLNATFIGTGKTVPKFTMFINRVVPTIISGRDDAVEITGEVFDVPSDALSQILSTERLAGYREAWILAKLENGQEVQVMIFVYPYYPDRNDTLVPSGDYSDAIKRPFGISTP